MLLDLPDSFFLAVGETIMPLFMLYLTTTVYLGNGDLQPAQLTILGEAGLRITDEFDVEQILRSDDVLLNHFVRKRQGTRHLCRKSNLDYHLFIVHL